MAEDKIKREKKKKKVEQNIYAIDFNFGDETEMETGAEVQSEKQNVAENEEAKEMSNKMLNEVALEDENIYDISRGIQGLTDDEEFDGEYSNYANYENEEKTPNKKKTLSKIEEGIKSSKIGSKRGRKPKIKNEELEEENQITKTTKTEKIAKTRKSKKEAVSRQSAIKMHTEDNLTEIKLKENIYKIELQKTEYNIYTEPSETSYIIVREPSLRMVAGTAYILLEKQGDDYLVKTNQDFKINYLIDNLERKDKIVNFKLTNLTQIEANEDGLIFEIDEEKIIENTLEDNKTLVISEEDGKVYLPYTKDEIKEEVSQHKGVKIGELIEEKYILPLDKYKNSMKARFREGYNLMRKKEGKSRKSAILLGFELMFETNLHPAIISACKNLQELDIYLDCLEDNELEKFSCFKIIYKSLPTIRKTKKMQEF